MLLMVQKWQNQEKYLTRQAKKGEAREHQED
jgi:hypothetical protein